MTQTTKRITHHRSRPASLARIISQPATPTPKPKCRPRAAQTELTSYAQRQVLEATYHEAGHAVVSYLVGIPFTAVLVKERGAGQITFDPEFLDRLFPGWATDPKVTRDYVTRNVVMTLAGPVAQSIFTRRWIEQAMNDGDDEDMAFAVAMLLYPRQNQVRVRLNLVNHLRFRAISLLMQPEVWRAVEILAAALVERRRLSGVEATSIIRQALPETGHLTRCCGTRRTM